MEHAQRVIEKKPLCPTDFVLILILMEHAQRGLFNSRNDGARDVLILILMEHAQRVHKYQYVILDLESLNPYFNGTCSKRETSWTLNMLEKERS